MSSRVGSGRCLGRVGDGLGSYGGCLRVKSGRVGLGSGSSRGRVGVVWGLFPCQVGPGRVGVWVESGTGVGTTNTTRLICVGSKPSGRGFARLRGHRRAPPIFPSVALACSPPSPASSISHPPFPLPNPAFPSRTPPPLSPSSPLSPPFPPFQSLDFFIFLGQVGVGFKSNLVNDAANQETSA